MSGRGRNARVADDPARLYDGLLRAFGSGPQASAVDAGDVQARVVRAVLLERFRRAEQLVEDIHESGDDDGVQRVELAGAVDEIAIGLERLEQCSRSTDPSYQLGGANPVAEREKIRQYFDRLLLSARERESDGEQGGVTAAPLK